MKARFNPRNWTIRARIALTIFAACSGALLLMALAVYFAFRQNVLRNFDDSLRTQATNENKFIGIEDGQPSLRIEGPGDDLTMDDAGFVQLYGRTQSLIASDTDVPSNDRTQRLVARGLAGESALDTVKLRGFEFRVFVRPVRQNADIVGALLVGSRRDSVWDTLDLLVTILLFAVPLTSGLLAIIAFSIAKRTLRPVREITLAARNIAAGDLSSRIAEGPSQDEVGELATTFNQMIGRLEETIERERRFTGDASHELRTPLTAIDAALEVTLSQERSAEQYRAVLVSLHKRTSQLTHMARQLLLLSRMDADAMKREFVQIHVTELLSAVVDAFCDTHPETELRFEHSAPAVMLGDTELLATAFSNILENSAVHAPGASICLEVGRSRREVFVSFEDDGPGIPPEHLPNVLQRFNRGASSQERHGAGLGLAIVESVVQAHKGRVTVASSGRGTKVTLHFSPAS